jgi:hypothetical protein
MTITSERRMVLLALLVVTLFLPSEVTSEFHIRPLVMKESQEEPKNLPIRNEVSRTLHSSSSSSSSSSKSSKSKSSKGPPPIRRLEAEFKSRHRDYKDLDGFVKIKFNVNDGDNEDNMRIEYEVADGPESCEDCYVAVLRAKTCKKKTLKESDLFHKDGDDNNPWNIDDSGFTTSRRGHASGTLFGLNSGKDGRATHCRAAVIYGPPVPESSSSSSKSSKSSKSHKSYRRNLHDDDHHHHDDDDHDHDDDDGDSEDDDDDDDDDIVILACGMLHKIGKRNDC